MTKRTQKMVNATVKVMVKSYLYATSIEGGKLYIEKEKKAYKKGGKIRKGLAVMNIALICTGIYEAIRYGQEITEDFGKELLEAEGLYDPELDDIQIQE